MSESEGSATTGGGMAPGGGTEVQYVSANGTVDLALAVEGIAEGTACSFEIKKVSDGSVVTTIQGQVTNGVCAGVWTPELDPEAGERGIRVYYLTTVEDRTERSPELEVYLDYVDIESQDGDGNPLPDATYQLRVTGPGNPAGGTVRRGRTGSTGKIRETAVPPGEAVLEWVGPWELIAWVDETGPTRKAKLKKVERLRFAWPSPHGEGGLRYWNEDGTENELDASYHAHTQLVNYDATDTTREATPERGNVVRLRITASPKDAGVAGAKVHVKVVWAPAEQLSPRTSPARALVNGSTDLPWATGDGTQGIALTIPVDEGETSVDVNLGRAGGDVCTVYLGCTSRCEDAKLVITNRRTVGYQLTRRAHQSLPALDGGTVSAVKYIDQLHADLTQVGEDLVYADVPPVDGTTAYASGLTVCPASWFAQGAAGDAVVIGIHNFDWYSSKVRAELGATGVHLVLADQMVNGTQASGLMPFVQGVAESWWSSEEAEDGTVTPDYTYFARIPDTEGARLQLFPRAFHDGGLPLRAEWYTPNDADLPADVRRKTGPIPAEWITVDRHRQETRTRFGAEESYDGRFGAWVTFPEDSIPGRCLFAAKNVRVMGEIYPGQTGMLGLSSGQLIVVKLAGVSDEIQNHALAHEVGHNMRQAAAHEDRVPDTYHAPPGMDLTQHRWGYTGKEHVGAHCSAGLTDEQRAGDDYTDVDGTCVMFGSVDEESVLASTGFCEDCQKFGRASALTDLTRDASVAALLASGSGEAQDDPPPVVEVALAHDPRQDFPAKGKLKVTAGGAAAPAATLVSAPPWSFTRLTPEAGKTYKLELEHKKKTYPILDGEDLEAFAQAGVGAAGANLVVLARKADANGAYTALTVTQASLVEAGDLGDGHLLPDGKGDISTVPAGTRTLRVTCSGEDAPIEVPLILAPPADVLFETPRAGCTIVRVRAGRPDAWGPTWFFVTVAPPTQRILVAPSNQGSDSDRYSASNAANALRDYYKKKGFTADIIRTARPKSEGAGPPTLCDSWEEILSRLEGAAAEPYARVFTIGHGGYDGTWMNGYPSQLSLREEPDSFWRFVDAIKTGTTPDARLFFSSCHSAGSNSGEWADAEKTDADYKKTEDDCKAKQAAAEKNRDAATTQADKDRWDGSAKDWEKLAADAAEQRKYNQMYFARWSEEVARASGRVCAGTMGYTSTDKLVGDTESRSLSHARAALEGESAARQALWLTDPTAPGGSWVVPAGKTSAAKEATFRGKAITYPGPLARTGAGTTPPAAASPTTTWVPPPLADLPAAVASTGGN